MTTNGDTLPMHRRAFIVFHELSEPEQNLVTQELSRLWHRPRGQWPADRLRPLKHEPSLNLFRVDDSLRVVLRWQDETHPEITDILRQETLDALAAACA